jgi:hypothetical protein
MTKEEMLKRIDQCSTGLSMLIALGQEHCARLELRIEEALGARRSVDTGDPRMPSDVRQRLIEHYDAIARPAILAKSELVGAINALEALQMEVDAE